MQQADTSERVSVMGHDYEYDGYCYKHHKYCQGAVIAASGKAVNDAVNELASPSSTQEHDKATPSSSKNAPSGEQSSQEMTTSQENALESAQSYLDMSGFSRTGLIEQLSSQAGEGFPKADAVWAVNHVDVDWNKEAVEAAKSYLQISSFSRDGLIQQLSSPAGDQFTKAQAVYAANQVGL